MKKHSGDLHTKHYLNLIGKPWPSFSDGGGGGGGGWGQRGLKNNWPTIVFFFGPTQPLLCPSRWLNKPAPAIQC
jgi:hypothetical protein